MENIAGMSKTLTLIEFLPGKKFLKVEWEWILSEGNKSSREEGRKCRAITPSIEGIDRDQSIML
jgi:hypothetical protein